MCLLLNTDNGYRSYETLCIHHFTNLLFFCFVDILEYFPDSKSIRVTQIPSVLFCEHYYIWNL